MKKHTKHIDIQKLLRLKKINKFCPIINGCLCFAFYHMRCGLIDGGTGQSKVFAWLYFRDNEPMLICNIISVSE